MDRDKFSKRVTVKGSESRAPKVKEAYDSNVWSFSPFASLESRIITSVNILEANGIYEQFVDDTKDFKSEGDRSWKIMFIPLKSISMSKTTISLDLEIKDFYNIRELRNVTFPKTSKSIKFHFLQFQVVLQFMHNEHFLYFKKILLEIVRVQNLRKSSSNAVSSILGSSVGVIPKFEHRRVSTVDIRSLPASHTEGSGSLISTISGCNSTKARSAFYLKSADTWSLTNYHQWLDCLHIPTDEGDSTILRYLIKTKLIKNFDEFMSNRNEIRNYNHLLEEFKNVKKNKSIQKSISFVDPCLLPILFHKENRGLSKRLFLEVQRLSDSHGKFNPAFSLVLRKRLEKRKKQQFNRDRDNLIDLEKELIHRRREWWDVEACKTQILSFLIFNKNIEGWISETEKDFNLFELRMIREHEKMEKKKQLLEKKNKNMNKLVVEKEKFLTVEEISFSSTEKEKSDLLSTRTEGNLIPLSIKERNNLDPELWDKILIKFNKLRQIRFEQISFRAFIAVEQNKFRFQKKRKLKEVEDKKEELKLMKINLQKHRDSMNNVNAQISAFMEKITPSSEEIGEKEEIEKLTQSQFDRVLKTINLKQKQLKRMKLKTSELEKKIEIIKKKINSMNTHISSFIESAIENCIPELCVSEKEKFLRSEKRRNQIRQKLTNELLSQMRGKGIREFVLKLVVSIRKTAQEIGTWQASLMKKIDPIFRPKYYKWGFLHSNILVANFGIHFFANSLVYLNDLSLGDEYEEIAALDLNCGFLVDSITINDRIQQIAEEIVYSNVNYEYSTFSVFKNSDDSLKINCQEFTQRLMKILGATPFFPIVEKYLDDLKVVIVENEEKRGPLRWIPVANGNKKLRKRLETVCVGKYRIDDEKVYFRTHSEIDEFYKRLMKVEGFNLQFPGVIQLLKSFDRAFWMLHKNYPEDEKYFPLNNKCPIDKTLRKIIEF